MTCNNHFNIAMGVLLYYAQSITVSVLLRRGSGWLNELGRWI